MPTPTRRIIPLLAALLFAALPALTLAEEPVDFGRDVAPILRQHCIRCHSPGKQEGDLSLATFDGLKENAYVVAGDPESSHLVDLITGSNGQSPEMPKEGEPLSDAQVALITRWIAAGAKWPESVVVRPQSRADATWWSLQPLRTFSGAGETAIDDLVRAKLAEHGWSLNPPADRRTLIRRATYDLTGLPPTPEQVADFVADTRPDAYQRLIDRLLNSPHYGERWGRHWLDVVRFGESNGFERNVIINSLWPFRDYVIRSINEDKPFDQFIREHLAGDVIAPGDPDIAVGSAFLVAGPYDDVGNQDPAQAAQIRANTLDEIISATSQAFLGLTLACARCHDHKFDPITQSDYYSLYATFAGIRHGEAPLATAESAARRAEQLRPLNEQKASLQQARQQLTAAVLQRAQERLAQYEARWTRPPVDRTGTEEQFEPVVAKFVRLVCEAQDTNPAAASGFRIDEFEVWSDDVPPRNVALAANGAKASGQARQIEDFPGAYGPRNAIDGSGGAQFIATGNDLTIELAEPVRIDRVVFSSARDAQTPEHSKFAFVADYRIEVSSDGQQWREVAHGRDRRPAGSATGDTRHRDHRLLQMETASGEQARLQELSQQLAEVERQIASIPAPPVVWIGTRSEQEAQGPFHVFLGGSPQKKGEQVVPASPAVFHGEPLPSYQLPADATEAGRRRALADWITDPHNPLAPRVLANRLWHYHFGTGIVDTPNDFGYMGGRPSHPELLDFLAAQLIEHGWRLKPIHRLIMTSQAYQQSSDYRQDAARVDGDARLLWRFPPRRLSAEEIRDTMLTLAGKLKGHEPSESPLPLVPDGGPGFRLYHFMQDNVCTYVPLDVHGPETYRRAVYHQNARASIVDLMTDFDQPDCALSSPKRAETTTPLQALTMLNHRFTLDMAEFLAQRLRREAGDDTSDDASAGIRRAYQLCYSRNPTPEESAAGVELIEGHGWAAWCRVLLNTSELIYVQ